MGNGYGFLQNVESGMGFIALDDLHHHRYPDNYPVRLFDSKQPQIL
jgi:hypothetical protein